MQKKVMRKAVKLAKKMTGDWIARMALALKIAWREVKEMAKKFKDVKKFSRSNEWKKYGKHRIYIDAKISLIELKEIRGNKIGAFRAIEENMYFDVKEGKLYYTRRNGKDLSHADESVVEYMKKEIRNMVDDELAKFGIKLAWRN